MPGDLIAMDGSELSYFESNFWYQQDSNGEMPPAAPPAGGGLSFENATYEAGLNRVRIQLFGDIDTAMSNEFSIRENIKNHTDPSFNNPIPGAVSDVTLMGNSIEIDTKDTALLSTFTAPGTDLYVKFDGMPGDLVAMDGSELSYFESSFRCMRTTAQEALYPEDGRKWPQHLIVLITTPA